MLRLTSKLFAVAAVACSLVAGVGCADVDPTEEETNEETSTTAAASQALHCDDDADDDVQVTTTTLGQNRYRVVGNATFDNSAEKIWPTFHDFEKLATVALGVTNFVWLNHGGPGKVPSSFQFASGGATIVEEVYYRNKETHTLRYRLLEPALGFATIDSTLQLKPISNNKKVRFTSTRDITLEPGGSIDAFAGLVVTETKNMQTYFAKKKN